MNETKEPTPIVIRRARAEDFVNIMRLLEIAVQENEVAYPPIDNMRLMRWIVECKENGEILVACVERNIIGVLGMLTKEWPWSSEKFIGSEFFFVQKKFRKHGTADNLLKAAEKFSDDHKIRLIFGYSGGKNAELKDRWMQMKGWIWTGGTFCRLPR